MKSILVAVSCAPMEKRSKPEPHRSAQRPSLAQRLLSTWFHRPAICSLVFLCLIATLVLVVHAANTQNELTSTSETASLLVDGNWSLNHVPTVSEDAVYTGTTTGIRTVTAGNLTVGSFNHTGGGGLFSIRNHTVTATDR